MFCPCLLWWQKALDESPVSVRSHDSKSWGDHLTRFDLEPFTLISLNLRRQYRADLGGVPKVRMISTFINFQRSYPTILKLFIYLFIYLFICLFNYLFNYSCTGELGYDGPPYNGLLHMTDDMLGPSPMHIKYSSYVYDGFCIWGTNFPGPIVSVISKFTCITMCQDLGMRGGVVWKLDSPWDRVTRMRHNSAHWIVLPWKFTLLFQSTYPNTNPNPRPNPNPNPKPNPKDYMVVSPMTFI